jgi:hypothetical protein
VTISHQCLHAPTALSVSLPWKLTCLQTSLHVTHVIWVAGEFRDRDPTQAHQEKPMQGQKGTVVSVKVREDWQAGILGQHITAWCLQNGRKAWKRGYRRSGTLMTMSLAESLHAQGSSRLLP